MALEPGDLVLVDKDKIKCKKCGKEKKISKFYRYAHSEKRFNICKECLSEQIDMYVPETFLWLLDELGFPFVKEKWLPIVRRCYDKGAFGKYLKSFGQQ